MENRRARCNICPRAEHYLEQDLIWANSPWAASYVELWHTPLGIRIGAFEFERSLESFVNDALMVIFFFVVGMEIRREVHHGELPELRRAALPAAAALGGQREDTDRAAFRRTHGPV